MERGKYQFFVVCVRDKCCGQERFEKKGLHAEGNFTSDRKALERFWQIAHKDLERSFDRVNCSVLRSGIRIGMFHFPEKRV